MPFPKPIPSIAITVFCVAACVNGVGDEMFIPQASEYNLSGPLPGDQVQAAVALNSGGGILVWEDNFTDGDGSGISARLLDGSFSGILSSFRVNEAGQGNQSKPAAAMLSDGSAVLVWEGGSGGLSDIQARFLTSSNTWATGDVAVHSHTAEAEQDPAVAALTNGACVVVWSSYNQAGSTSMKDVYLQRLSSTGGKLGSMQRVNQTSTLNQRTPAVARLSDGRFVVAWINETKRIIGGVTEVYDVDVYARIFSATGVAQGNEFKVNVNPTLCANPAIAASSDGGFLVVWSRKDPASSDDGWDIACRPFTGAGVGGTESVLNVHRAQDQFGPSVAALGSDYMVVWTSDWQDGSREGVFGRFVGSTGVAAGDEFQVNTTVVNLQLFPCLASDGGTRFLTVWSGFTGVAEGFDVFAQRYATVTEPLPAPEPPYVWPLNFSEILVSWGDLDGFDVADYLLYVDGAATPTVSVTDNQWTLTNAAPYSTHTFRLAYTLQDGRTSPKSGLATGTTYGQYGTITYGEIVPFDWMVAHWGLNFAAWPAVGADFDGDGASDENEFLAGTDPRDPDSVLRTALTPTAQGFFLQWNTEPGKIYQVQHSANFATWDDLGGPRFAPGDVDFMNVGGSGSGMFRVKLLRN